jgi:DNA-binding PadR family transcriptional regulator
MATARLRLTKPTLAVLDVLLAAQPGEDVWGLRICERADLGSGTVYPILDRLERAGWVVGAWEVGRPAGRPRRRLYRMTGEGRAELAAGLAARTARTASRLRLAGQPAAHGRAIP